MPSPAADRPPTRSLTDHLPPDRTKDRSTMSTPHRLPLAHVLRRPRRALALGALGALGAVLVACSGSAPASQDGAVSTSASASASGSPSRPAAPPGTPTPDPAGAPTCAVEYTVTNQWEGEFQADVVVTALGAPVTSWALGWSFADGQRVGQTWNATASQTSAAVSMTAVEHNAVLGAGESATFGFIASWQATNSVPTDFTLDGAPCTGPQAPAAPGGTPAPAGPADTAATFYTNPATQAAAAAQAATGETRTLLDKIAQTPQALWVGSWSSADQARVSLADHSSQAAAAGQVPLVVVYAIPGRDCGNHSAGGVATSEYAAWIDTIASGITGTPWIVLEPDALAQLGDCQGQGDRVGYLRYAAETLTLAGGRVYIDAGHPAWLSAGEAARRLTLVGFDHAAGFALNTSNYQTTEAARGYGEEVSALVGGRTFVVDTSRNGAGPDGTQWCNPAGRGLGAPSQVVTDGTRLDALIWAKAPGESDGACNGGPAAGQWWQDGALELARNASW